MMMVMMAMAVLATPLLVILFPVMLFFPALVLSGMLAIAIAVRHRGKRRKHQRRGRNSR
jgi:hypothetical protein